MLTRYLLKEFKSYWRLSFHHTNPRRLSL